MILWLWDADGPARRGRGVTDDQARAFQIADTYLRSGYANVAKVESARLVLGAQTLTFEYQRSGEGWHGRRGDCGIRWEPIIPTSERAAS